jgi:hypothetical protein
MAGRSRLKEKYLNCHHSCLNIHGIDDKLWRKCPGSSKFGCEG